KYDEAFVHGALQYTDSFEKQTVVQTVKLMERYKKPIIGVYLLSDNQTQIITDVNGCKYKGVNFITPEKAVKALAKMCQYSEWLNS
ncbi:MAG TPA: hypothetical protein PKZ86_10205, partial [Smithella sp.]|nr:hypothetical protein [Smithella sp.]